MIIEEKKANKLRCCGPLAETKCQGSQCMAWRWDFDYSSERISETELDITGRYSTTHGYCGLAGRP